MLGEKCLNIKETTDLWYTFPEVIWPSISKLKSFINTYKETRQPHDIPMSE